MILKNKFYILRHGETVYQTIKKDFVYPRRESINVIGLTRNGKIKIKETAFEIKKKKIDYIYSSDFKRARETSLIVADGIGLEKEKIFFSKNLRDINLGKYHGKKKNLFYKEMPCFLMDFNSRPSKGESLKEAQKRVVDFIKFIDKKHENQKILIVSHGELLWLLEISVKKIKRKDYLGVNFIKNNYISTGEIRELN